MDRTAIKAGAPTPGLSSAIKAGAPTLSAGGMDERTQPRSAPKHGAVRLLEVVASLRITVVLFVLAMVLVFFGSWAQKDASGWYVVNHYFRAFLVWIPFKVLLLHTNETIQGSLPY